MSVQEFERSMKRNTDDIFKAQREKKRLQQKLGELEESSKIDYSDLESEKEDLDRERYQPESYQKWRWMMNKWMAFSVS